MVLLNFPTLNRVQSCYKQIKSNNFPIQQFHMLKISNHFTQLADRLQGRELYSEVFQKQSLMFDIAAYRIKNISCQTMIKLYENIWKKYKITKELSVNENNWHQNQRRVFVWFIICYTYLLKKEENLPQIKLDQDQEFWKTLSEVFFNKNPELLQFQYLNLTKIKRRESWTQQEDHFLLQAMEAEAQGRWNQISKKMFYNSNKMCFRSPKQCRERWLNHLDKTKKRGDWSPLEDYTIFKHVIEEGKHWCKIVPLLNHARTEHMIKNRYHSTISKFININNKSQEEAARAIFAGLKNEISKQMELSSSQEKFSQKKNETHMTIEEDDVERSEEKQIVEILTPEPSRQEVNFYLNAPAFYYTYFMDFNSNIYNNVIIPTSVFSEPNIFSQEFHENSLKLSTKSCFTAYNTNALA